MTKKITKIKMKNEFRVCPNCGYEDGFHSMFETTDKDKEYSWKFICPDCHKIFDIGLKVSL